MSDRLDVERLEKMGRWARLMELLGAGFSDPDAREKMGLTVEQYDKLRAEAFQFEAERLRKKTNEEIYVEYMINQAQCVKALTTLASEFKERKNASAMVSAIRARSEIYDKIIKTGQDFGIVKRKVERSEHRLSVLVAHLDSEELKTLAVSELQNIDRLMQMCGDQNILDITPGKIHRTLPASKPAIPKRAKAKQNPVHRGRRVVRGGDLKD